MTLVAGIDIMLEEYAREHIYLEMQQIGQVDKRLRKPGDIAAFEPTVSQLSYGLRAGRSRHSAQPNSKVRDQLPAMRAVSNLSTIPSSIRCNTGGIPMMKLVLIAGLGFALQQITSQVPPRDSLTGIVVRDDTDEPIRNARLTGFKLLTGAERGRAVASGTLAANVNATTDNAGRFVFRDLEASAYGFTIYADGYARKNFGVCLADNCSSNFFPNSARDRSSISLLPKSALSDLRLGLTPGANISGRVRDQYGKPLAGVTVQLLVPTFDFSARKSTRAVGESRTDDHGDYRIFWITPGRYILVAGSALPSPLVVPADIGSSNEVEGRVLLPTFFPNGSDPAAAQTLEVKAGSELAGIDIQVPRLQMRRVRGRIVDAMGQPPRAVTVRLFSSAWDTYPSVSIPEQSYDPRTGQYELPSVPSGANTLRIESLDPSLPATGAGPIQFFFNNGFLSMGNLYSQPVTAVAEVPIEAADSDIEGLNVVLQPPISISGQVRVEGESSTNGSMFFQFQLLPIRSGFPTSSLTVPPASIGDEKGIFVLSNVLPGNYRLGVAISAAGSGFFPRTTNLPEDAYVKEARLGAQDIRGEIFTISPGAAGRLDVVIGKDGSRLEGLAVDDQQNPVSGGTVVLAPIQNRERIDRIFWSDTDEAGHFQVQRIPPGDYKLFAFRELEAFAFYEPSLLTRYETQGVSVHVAGSSHQNLTVRIMREVP